MISNTLNSWPDTQELSLAYLDKNSTTRQTEGEREDDGDMAGSAGGGDGNLADGKSEMDEEGVRGGVGSRVPKE